MSVRLIAFDLDNTLLNRRKQISDDNMAALREAQAAGIYTVPASGRLYPGLPAELHGPAFRYCILGNGSSLYDSAEDRYLLRYEIPLETALQLFDYAESTGISYDSYMDDRPYISRSFYQRLPDLIEDPSVLRMMLQLRQPVDDLRTYVLERGKPVQKIQLYIFDPALRLKLLEELPSRFPSLSVTSSLYCNIEMADSRADKGNALEALCSALKLNLSEAMAFGDGLNDLGMVSRAGVGVAMDNAEQALKDAAAFVTKDCDDSGVAYAIREFI